MASQTARDILDEGATTFESTTSVGEAIDRIRTQSGRETTVYYAYVTDDMGRIDGVTSMRDLLNATDEQPISEVTTESVVIVEASDPIDHVAKVITKHGFTVLPVVDTDGTLLGIVRAEDVIEALDEESSKAVLKETVRDVQYDPSDESPYECFECGTIVEATDNPGECPSCGSDMRHRRTPIE